jgi:UDPglucose 6-dehydrogenase
VGKIRTAFLGSGHLGICHAIAADKLGFDVAIFDINTESLSNLSLGNLELSEPGVRDYVLSDECKIEFVKDLKKLSNYQLIILALDVKVDSSGNSDLTDLNSLINSTIKYINIGSSLIIMSQVSPGYSRKICNLHVNTYYQMETLIFGDALNRAENPERIVIGKSDLLTPIDQDLKIYLNSFRCPVIEMTLEEAEFSKQAANIFLASTITTTNVLASLCEKYNLSWSRIKYGLKLDKRIGAYSYLEPGLGIGGTNILRDLQNVKGRLEGIAYGTEWVDIIVNVSNSQKKWLTSVLKTLVNYFPERPRVGILGVTYKENIASIYGSAPYSLLLEQKDSFLCSIFDPIWKVDKSLNVTQVKHIEEIYLNCNIILIGNKDLRFKDFDFSKFEKVNKTAIIVDPYNLLNDISLPSNIKKITIGEGYE